MSGWLRFCSWIVALLMLLVPTRFGLAAAAMVVTGPRSTVAERLGFSSAKPYTAVMLRETAGRTGVNLSKALAHEGPGYVDLVIPTTGYSSLVLRVNQVGLVISRTTTTVTEGEKTTTLVRVENGKTTANLTVDKRSNQITKGWVIQDSKSVDMKGWTPPPPSAKGDGTQICTIWDWFRCWNDCLASHGIAAWAITLIGAACAGVCGATLGLGCAACIAAPAMIASWVIGSCIGRCEAT